MNPSDLIRKAIVRIGNLDAYTDLRIARRKPVWLPTTIKAIEADERTLGFALPASLKALYTEVGNGGLGPGYGLIGMSEGSPDDTSRTAPEIYASFREPGHSKWLWEWPTGLLPICHWGCGIYSCIDCTTPAYPMRLFDPNVLSLEYALSDEGCSFDKWICDWVDGVDLWERASNAESLR